MQDNTVPSVLPAEKKCSMCTEMKPAEMFYVTKGKLSSRCKSCTRQQVKTWMKENRETYQKGHNERYNRRYARSEKMRMYVAQKTQRRYRRLQRVVFDHYGRICICCGETNPKFLTIDHVNNDGAQFRTRTGGGRHGATGRLYAFIIRNGFPLDFQVNCYNCNCGKARNDGVCPHQDEGVEAIPSGSTLERAEVHTTLPITYGC